jgi:hypothetical protein
MRKRALIFVIGVAVLASVVASVQTPAEKALLFGTPSYTAGTKGVERVELAFDIRNWFKMGPVKYHSVVASLRGTEFPDEYVVVGGHFDCFSGATGRPPRSGRRSPASTR